MKRILLLLPAFALGVACADNPVTEPEMAVTEDLGVDLPVYAKRMDVKMVPFKAKGTYWISGFGPPGCEDTPEAVLFYLGFDGNATHMGKIEGTAANCVIVEEDGSYTLLSQTSTMVAASGDAIFSYGSASDGARLNQYADGSWDLGPVPVIAGTGRFKNASGWYILSGPEPGGGPYQTVGEISSVGSSN